VDELFAPFTAIAPVDSLDEAIRLSNESVYGLTAGIFSEDPAEFIAQALSPSQVKSVTLVDESTRSARVVVPDFQLSLAIGKEGQNARLAAKLTGWRIDIRSDTAVDPSVADKAPSTTDGDSIG